MIPLVLSAATDYVALGGFVVLVIAAIGGQIVNIITAWRAPDKIIAAANKNATTVAAAATLAANKLAATTKTSAAEAHQDRLQVHEKLDAAAVVGEHTQSLVNGAKTALEDLVAKRTNERDSALRELGRDPPPLEEA